MLGNNSWIYKKPNRNRIYYSFEAGKFDLLINWIFCRFKIKKDLNLTNDVINDKENDINP